MYTILEFNNLIKDEFYAFLKEEFLNSNDPARINMWNEQWTDHPNTLPYLLENSNRFKDLNGNFYILKHQDRIIGCGGVYISEFSNDISFCGTRLWMTKEYRNRSIFRETLLPAHKEWSIKRNCKVIALCLNEYNKNFVKTFYRKRLGERINRLSTRLPKHLFYNGVEEVSFPVRIQNTKQYVVYEKLDKNFNFDWSLIKY